MHAVLTHRLLIGVSLLLFALVFFGAIAAPSMEVGGSSMAPTVSGSERAFAVSAI
jgi:hypothetical protein